MHLTDHAVAVDDFSTHTERVVSANKGMFTCCGKTEKEVYRRGYVGEWERTDFALRL